MVVLFGLGFPHVGVGGLGVGVALWDGGVGMGLRLMGVRARNVEGRRGCCRVLVSIAYLTFPLRWFVRNAVNIGYGSLPDSERHSAGMGEIGSRTAPTGSRSCISHVCR